MMISMLMLTALCTPRGVNTGWDVHVPQIDGLVTHAPRYDQILRRVLDAATLLTHRPECDFDVRVIVRLEGQP